MRHAVRLAGKHLGAAEEETDTAWIADRPPAYAARQCEKCAPLRVRNVRIRERIVGVRLCACDPSRSLALPARQRSGLITPRPCMETNGLALEPPDAAVGRCLNDAETMNLCQHGAATDVATQFSCDLLGGHPLRPSRFHELDALFGPRRRRVPADAPGGGRP